MNKQQEIKEERHNLDRTTQEFFLARMQAINQLNHQIFGAITMYRQQNDMDESWVLADDCSHLVRQVPPAPPEGQKPNPLAQE